MAKYYKKIIKFVMLFMGLIIFYAVFLVAGHAIPRSLVIDNAQKSYEQLDSLGLYFKVVEGASWDNLTDSFFINTAVTEYNGNLLEKALANAYTTSNDNNGWQSVVDGIICSINENEDAIVESYSRYWIGILTIYKALLVFMPIRSIRTLIFSITIILFAISVLNIYRMLGTKGLIPYLASVIAALYIPQAMCLVFSTDIIMMLLMMNICCIMLQRDADIDKFYVGFFVGGSVLAYLNYWGFPLIMLGFPLVLFVTVRLVNGYSSKTLIKETILISISWAVGLAGTILAKQILCKIVLGTQTGTSQLLYRMGSEFSMSARWAGMINSLVKANNLPLMIVAVIIWTILLFKTKCFKRWYPCYLLVLVAFYPVVWSFVLVQHSVLGFVDHMYGVTYYALLSAIFINCESYIPSLSSLGSITKKEVCVNIAIIGGWLVLSYIFLNTIVHYGTTETEPWSMETIDTVNLGEQSVTQEVHFDDLVVGKAYLKNIRAILVNIPDDKKQGALHVEFAQDGDVLGVAEVSIADVDVGEWFEIPMKCVIDNVHNYQITYSVKDANGLEPYFLVQDDAQAARENYTLYINGVARLGSITNQYEYDEYILSKKAKVSIMFIILFILQYIMFLYEEKMIWFSVKDRNVTLGR